MNKEEILKRSREEFQDKDEREEKVELRSYALSALIGGLLCLAFVIFEGRIFDRSTMHIWAIYSGMMFSKNVINATKLKKRTDIGFSILWGIIFVLTIIMYIIENI